MEKIEKVNLSYYHSHIPLLLFDEILDSRLESDQTITEFLKIMDSYRNQVLKK